MHRWRKVAAVGLVEAGGRSGPGFLAAAMPLAVGLLLAAARPAAVAAADSAESAATPSILIRGARLFDPRAGEFTAPADVLILADSIAAVGKDLSVPAGARVIDGTGRYALPGLFDCHTHLAHLLGAGEDSVARSLAGFVARGITQVRDVGGPLGTLSGLARRSRELSGPEIFYSGPMLERRPLTHGAMNDSLPGFTAAIDSREAVDSLLAELDEGGAGLVKTFGKADSATYRHLVEEARRLGLPVTHDPGEPLFHRVPLERALDLGVRCFEHAKAPWPAVLRDDLRREHDALLDSLRAGRAHPMQAMGFALRVAELGAASVDTVRLHDLGARLRERGACLCPTLVVLDDLEAIAFEQTRQQQGLQEIPEPMKAAIRRMISAMEAVSRLCVRILAAERVRLLVGQDGCDPSATAREMRRMAACGVPAVEILRGATLYPAEWLGADGRLGSIAPGKQADLVLLEADPLEEIGRVEAIAAVICRGRVALPANPRSTADPGR